MEYIVRRIINPMSMERNNGLLRSTPIFFIGQVAPKQEKNKRDLTRLGSRVRVRIMGIHSPDGNINPDSTLDYAHVLHPNSHGNLNMMSTALIGGEMVIGIFLRVDGTTLKDPVIMGVLPTTFAKDDLLTADEAGEKKSTEFQELYPYWDDIKPAPFVTAGGKGNDSQSPAQLPETDFYTKKPTRASIPSGI
jgi:hypothetical protein